MNNIAISLQILTLKYLFKFSLVFTRLATSSSFHKRGMNCSVELTGTRTFLCFKWQSGTVAKWQSGSAADTSNRKLFWKECRERVVQRIIKERLIWPQKKQRQRGLGVVVQRNLIWSENSAKILRSPPGWRFAWEPRYAIAFNSLGCGADTIPRRQEKSRSK